MVATPAPQHEPSMQEILESIKKIIASDEDKTEPVDAVVEEDDDDVMDLSGFDAVMPETDAVTDFDADDNFLQFPESDVESQPEPTLQHPVDEQMDTVDFDDLDSFFSNAAETNHHANPVLESEPKETEGLDDSSIEQLLNNDVPAASDVGYPEPTPLLSDALANAVRGSVSNLVHEKLRISRSGDNTLEDIITAMLEPMIEPVLRDSLKGWLDTNLPPIVERIVQVEIRRLLKTAAN